MKQDSLKDLYEFYLSEKTKNIDSDTYIKNIKFLELALLRKCIDKLLKESEA